MADIARVKVRWSGFTGSPGYSVFHFRDFGGVTPTVSDVELAIDRVDAFFNAIKAYLPSVVNVKTQADVEVIDETNGSLVNVLQGTPTAGVNGTASGATPYAAATGAVLTWRTSGIRNGRRIRGRTFLVPMSSDCFSFDGTINGTALTTLTTAATALTDTTGLADLAVWARPTGPGATDGIAHAVTAFSIPDMSAVLRSRRD